MIALNARLDGFRARNCDAMPLIPLEGETGTWSVFALGFGEDLMPSLGWKVQVLRPQYREKRQYGGNEWGHGYDALSGIPWASSPAQQVN